MNRKLLPIKLHYFFFMAAMGPILPQLPLLGKYFGISPAAMGIVNGILPFILLIVKPLFGIIVDVCREWRKSLFIVFIIITIISFSGLYLAPPRNIINFEDLLSRDNHSNFALNCNKDVISVVCNSTCLDRSIVFLASFEDHKYKICGAQNNQRIFEKCIFECVEDTSDYIALSRSFTFWIFIILMSLGTIGFNVINSVSDAICFDIIDGQADYGSQRLWGSLGFGLAGLISGFIVNLFSKNAYSYEPAYIIMIAFGVLDILVCTKLKLPAIERPTNIFRNLKALLQHLHVFIFFLFIMLAGMVDGLIIYYLFWYLEDLAVETKTAQIKLIEGLILAAETMGAETLYFFISGHILHKLGHVDALSICFINYAIRLALISLAPSPWWFLPIELIMQGPTFALTYTVIVAYANDLAPAGMSATMQGFAVGMCDGTGYAVGSFLGGLSYKYFGGKMTFQIFTWVSLFCGISHFGIQILLKKNRNTQYQQLP